jgi:Uma2 family endonuclease
VSAIPQSAHSDPLLALQEYLRREEKAEYKSEFYRGEIFAMWGGSPEHNDVSGNIFAALRGRLRGSSCRPSNSDQRIRIPENGLCTYPDVSIVCGEREYDQLDPQAITNPVVVIEVLSPTTERYDRGKKFELYRELASLREYVLVSVEGPSIEKFTRRDDDTWVLMPLKGMDAELKLESAGIVLPFREIYEDIEFRPLDVKSAAPESEIGDESPMTV